MEKEQTLITFYTIDCPACSILKSKLDKKQIKYKTVTDLNMISKIADDNDIDNAPILQVDDIVYNYTDAIDWVNSL